MRVLELLVERGSGDAVGAPSNRGWFRISGADEVASWAAFPGSTDAKLRCFRAPAGLGERPVGDPGDAGYDDSAFTGLRSAPRWVAAAEAVALLELTAAGRSSD